MQHQQNMCNNLQKSQPHNNTRFPGEGSKKAVYCCSLQASSAKIHQSDAKETFLEQSSGRSCCTFAASRSSKAYDTRELFEILSSNHCIGIGGGATAAALFLDMVKTPTPRAIRVTQPATSHQKSPPSLAGFLPSPSGILCNTWLSWSAVSSLIIERWNDG